MRLSEEHIRAIAHLDARPDKTEELGPLLTSLLAPIRQEQGCVRFELQQNRDSPTEFAIVSEWRGEHAVPHHIATNYAQHALRRLPDRFAGSPILPSGGLKSDESPILRM